MHNCEYCDQSFKTIQGLLGHQRMKHNASTAQNSQSSADQNNASTAQNSQSSTPQHNASAAQNCQCSTEENKSSADQNKVVLSQEMRQEILAEGRVVGIGEIAEIPGVKDAVAFASSTERWNEEHPEHAIDENWALVPGVRDLIENSRPVLIKITRAEESSPGDGVIRVVTTPVGEIISQNGKTQ